MSTNTLDRDLQAFAVELFERSGGIADWPQSDQTGSVVVSPELAANARLPGEEFSMGTIAAPKSLHVGLASEFLDVAERVLNVGIPRQGSFCIQDRYLTSRDLTDRIARTFAWQNARAKCQAAEPAQAEYHLWTLLGSMRSEDVFEATFRFAVNVESRAVVDMPDFFQEPDVCSDAAGSPLNDAETYDIAVAEGKRRLIESSLDFVQRIEQRLKRDRKRLQDYYRALGREADGSKRRTAVASTPEEVAAKKRAVDLELRRKLAELNENYVMQATLRPVVVARVKMPALVVPITIQRKQAIRDYKLYWNSLMKKFEPLECARCHCSTYSATFENDTVDLLCTRCAEGI